ncbi:protein translocase subunit SecF [Mesorhizobium sp. RP14(2022)]|uniref:Protein-export membrane protein SecF n=1 Tax=Mesorhizobium liriopis TaxID=2953882 RepID=A0ABT1CB20_9HYPH|nr:protein translocase subunit SecF [Mesorhizobium liriopis]MCO6052022.1 protein translocase subunit SecF [Mesorhizobium liriopis]
MKPLRLVPDGTTYPFMKWAKVRTPISLLLIVVSFALFFTVGVNSGIDFKGGTVMEVGGHSQPIDIAEVRSKLDALELGEVQIQSIGNSNEVLIRVATQPGGDEAQQQVVQKVRAALGETDYDYRRVEVVGPRVSGELAWTGTLAVLFTIAGIMAYIWIRFEWQFGLAAVATLVHDAILMIGFFALTQIDFNLQSLAAILTVIGYSLNDTVVIFDRIREILRRYKQMPMSDVIDLATNQTLARTIMTSLTILLALVSLYLFGGPVVRSFTASMIWGIVVATASSIFIGGPILIYFNLRPEKTDAAVKPAVKGGSASKPGAVPTPAPRG